MSEHPNFQLWTLGRLNVLKTIDQLRPRSVDAEPVPARSGGQRGRLIRTGTEGTWTVVDAVCRCVVIPSEEKEQTTAALGRRR